nr:hypothetical protein [Tanacetum cinerariifolium]
MKWDQLPFGYSKEICKLIDKSLGYLISKAKKHYVLKVQVSGYNLDNNYHIFTANNITDDEDVIKYVIAKRTIDKETQDIFEDENTHSEGENMYQDKKLIADAFRISDKTKRTCWRHKNNQDCKD